MKVALKIWRYDSATGDRALREYEIDAPEEATLLDCLDIVKDQHDGSLAYRKSCRMMICGSCGMRMDGAAVLACKTRMYDIAQEGRVPVDLRDGEPADRQGPRRGHGSVLVEVQGDVAVARARLRAPRRRPRVPDLAGADERDPQGVALHQLRLLRLGVQRDGVGPRVPRAAGAREGHALRRRPARRRDRRAARALQPGARHLGLHALLLLQRALPEGRRPARRDREARRRVDPPRHRPRHGREAREVVRTECGDDGLAARGGADPQDAGLRVRDQAAQVRRRASRATARCARFRSRTRRRTSTRRATCARSSTSRTGRARSATSRASGRSRGSTHGHADESLEEIYERPGAAPRPWLPEVEEEAKA